MDWLVFGLFLFAATFGFLAGVIWASSLINRRNDPVIQSATRFVYLVNDEERVKQGGTPRYSAIDVENALEDLEASVTAYHNG